MNTINLKGQGGQIISVNGELVASCDALNHDETVRCSMYLYRTNNGYACQRIDRPDTIDVRFHAALCDDDLSVYQFLGTEPLANYLYGLANLLVPGIRKTTG